MRPQLPVRDRSTSLWQSAVRETLLKRGESTEARRAAEYAASLHAQAADKKQPLEDVVKASVAPADVAKTLEAAQASEHAFNIARAHRDGDTGTQATLFGKLKGLIADYSTLDVLGWAQCMLHYIEYYITAHSSPPYRYWDENKPQDISFGTIAWTLPAKSNVLVLGDWGTHMSDNVALLRQALKAFKIDAIIHLGDVYYSGTVSECNDNVLAVLDGLMAELKPDTRPPFFTIPGNHDYYSGGAGFFNMIDRVNVTLPTTCQQKASYFCLRTADNNWQFLGMDTGLNDRNPVDHMAPTLEKSEVTWHLDKLDKFSGTTVLLSHHQLFSANSKISDHGQRPYLNESLNAVFKPYYEKNIAAWFWGHEHNLVIFKDNQLFGDTVGLKKGRLVGCSAYEETVAESPYKKDPACTIVEYAPNMPELQISESATALQKNFYNHAFTVLEIAPEKIVANYYEYPSWDQDDQPAQEPAVGAAIFTEAIPRLRP